MAADTAPLDSGNKAKEMTKFLTLDELLTPLQAEVMAVRMCAKLAVPAPTKIKRSAWACKGRYRLKIFPGLVSRSPASRAS